MIITVCSNNMGDNQLSQPKSRGQYYCPSSTLVATTDYHPYGHACGLRIHFAITWHETRKWQHCSLLIMLQICSIIARVAPRFWRYIFDAHLLLTWGHETEHCTCSIIVIMTPERLPAPNESILQWHVWLLCMLRLKLKVTFNILHRNGVARNIKDVCEKLQLDHSINSVSNDILFVTCVDPSCSLTFVRWVDIVPQLPWWGRLCNYVNDVDYLWPSWRRDKKLITLSYVCDYFEICR